MARKQNIERRVGDYTDTELQIIMATLAGIDPGTVCAAIGLVVYHAVTGQHELVVLCDDARDTEATAALLEHVARDVRGTCGTCAFVTGKGSHGQGS